MKGYFLELVCQKHKNLEKSANMLGIVDDT